MPANQKRRNNEKRKEKSRVAARCRRTREIQLFSELSAVLPAKEKEVEQLDKASVMRLTISYLGLRGVVSMLPKIANEPAGLKIPKGLDDVCSEASFMNALDGFVLVLSQQGDIVFCTENISSHLGVSQLEMMGQSVYEFSHPCDHQAITEALSSSTGTKRDLLIRLKCTLTSKGRNVHLKSASYKVIRVTGHMINPDEKAVATDVIKKEDEKNINEDLERKLIKLGALVAVGRPIPHPSNIEVPIDSKTFLSKHSLDMKFTYTDEALMKTLGYEPKELMGRSLYEYHHADDSQSLMGQFKMLFSKGQCETGQYRFLAKTGGFAWVQTQATVITDKQQKPISVVCVNHVISGIECKDEVFAAHQVQNVDLKPKVALPVPLPAPSQNPEIEVPNGTIIEILPPETEAPIPATRNIFAPRKKQIDKGFLMFSQDEGLTMLKDDPEDLTHLAPTAGDACIPLVNSPFDLLDDFELLNNNYCGLWNDELTNGSPVDSLRNDSMLLSSPDPLETDSSCEKSSLLTDLSLDPFDNNRSDDIDDGNSPYIPTGDDPPVLESAVMWGALPDSVSQAKPQPSEIQTNAAGTALQRLLVAPRTGVPPQDLITNIYSDQGPAIPTESVSSWDTGVKRGIMKPEEEPYPKRVKRSPSPPQQTTTPLAPTATSQSSSVLMNLLDMQQSQLMSSRTGPQQLMPHKIHAHMPIINNNIPIPIIELLKNIPKNQDLRVNINDTSYGNAHAMTPLPLIINNSPIYSMPSSPTSNYSPAMSPANRDYLSSPYSTPQSMSPVPQYQGYSPNSRLSSPGVLKSDPYLAHKMQASPNFSLHQTELFIDSNVTSPGDFWTDSERNDFLSGLVLDDVKLS